MLLVMVQGAMYRQWPQVKAEFREVVLCPPVCGEDEGAMWS